MLPLDLNSLVKWKRFAFSLILPSERYHSTGIWRRECSYWHPNGFFKKTVFKEVVLKATICGSQGWQSWAERGKLASPLHFCTNANPSHQGAWSTAKTRAGRQEDMHVLGNLLVNPHLFRPYLYIQKSNPKSHPKPIPKSVRVRYDISEDTARLQGARLFWRK